MKVLSDNTADKLVRLLAGSGTPPPRQVKRPAPTTPPALMWQIHVTPGGVVTVDGGDVYVDGVRYAFAASSPGTAVEACLVVFAWASHGGSVTLATSESGLTPPYRVLGQICQDAAGSAFYSKQHIDCPLEICTASDGEDGADAGITVSCAAAGTDTTHPNGGTTVTLQPTKDGVADGAPIVVTIWNGANGTNGDNGVGISSISSGTSTSSNGVTTTPITVTLTNGQTQNFNVVANNGTDGTNGSNGVGISSITAGTATSSNGETTTPITVTLTNGQTQSFNVKAKVWGTRTDTNFNNTPGTWTAESSDVFNFGGAQGRIINFTRTEIDTDGQSLTPGGRAFRFLRQALRGVVDSNGCLRQCNKGAASATSVNFPPKSAYVDGLTANWYVYCGDTRVTYSRMTSTHVYFKVEVDRAIFHFTNGLLTSIDSPKSEGGTVPPWNNGGNEFAMPLPSLS